MLKKLFSQNISAVFFCFGCLFASNAPLECSSELSSYEYLQPMQNPLFNCIGLSHTEGKGLGYSQGYSSLDFFLAHPVCETKIIPFIDVRGHIFNNDKFALNAGAGLRWFNPCSTQMWGVNCFYDSLQTDHLTYHQVAFGLEVLSKTWDLRINGYLPVGHKKTPIYRLFYNFSSGFLAKAREQFAMGGIDAELGYHFCAIQSIGLYLGAGPYFYRGRSQKTENAFRAIRKEIVGGRLRASALFLNYFELEGITAYDSRFNWTGQVTLSLSIPFNWFCSLGKQESDCVTRCQRKERAFQPVLRNEMIVIDRINRFSSNPEILDPEFEP